MNDQVKKYEERVDTMQDSLDRHEKRQQEDAHQLSFREQRCKSPFKSPQPARMHQTTVPTDMATYQITSEQTDRKITLEYEPKLN